MVAVVGLHKMVVELHKMVVVLHKIGTQEHNFEPLLELQNIHTMELVLHTMELELLHSHRTELQALLNTHRMELQALLNTHKMEMQGLLHNHKMELQGRHKMVAHHNHLLAEHNHLLAQQEQLAWLRHLLPWEVQRLLLPCLRLGQLACHQHLVWEPACQEVLMGLFERQQWPRPQKTEQVGKSLQQSTQ